MNHTHDGQPEILYEAGRGTLLVERQYISISVHYSYRLYAILLKMRRLGLRHAGLRFPPVWV